MQALTLSQLLPAEDRPAKSFVERHFSRRLRSSSPAVLLLVIDELLGLLAFARIEGRDAAIVLSRLDGEGWRGLGEEFGISHERARQIYALANARIEKVAKRYPYWGLAAMYQEMTG